MGRIEIQKTEGTGIHMCTCINNKMYTYIVHAWQDCVRTCTCIHTYICRGKRKEEKRLQEGENILSNPTSQGVLLPGVTVYTQAGSLLHSQIKVLLNYFRVH